MYITSLLYSVWFMCVCARDIYMRGDSLWTMTDGMALLCVCPLCPMGPLDLISVIYSQSSYQLACKCSKVNLAVCNNGSLLPSSGVFFFFTFNMGENKTHNAGCKPLFHSIIIWIIYIIFHSLIFKEKPVVKSSHQLNCKDVCFIVTQVELCHLVDGLVSVSNLGFHDILCTSSQAQLFALWHRHIHLIYS